MAYKIIDNENTVWGEADDLDMAVRQAIENITETFHSAGSAPPKWLTSGDLESAGYRITK